MPNQASAPWKPHLELAKRILTTSETVSEAAAVLEAYLDRPVTEDALERAFRRYGLPPPVSWLRREKEPELFEPPPVESPPVVAEPPPAAPSIPQSHSGPTREKTYLVCSDVHVPGHSQAVMDAFIAIGKDIGADGVVIAGDYLDLNEVSRHSRGSVAHLEGRRVNDSFAAGRGLLKRMIHEIDCTDNYYVDGNHEIRIDKWMRTGDNAVWLGNDAMSIEKQLELKDMGFRYHQGWPDAYVKLGHVVITHGRYTNKHHAAKHLDTWRHSVIYGHTHRPQVFYAAGYDRQQVAVGLGYCADATSEAMSYAPTPNDWMNGFGLVSVRPSGVFHAEQINFYDDVTSFGGQLYGKGGRL